MILIMINLIMENIRKNIIERNFLALMIGLKSTRSFTTPTSLSLLTTRFDHILVSSCSHQRKMIKDDGKKMGKGKNVARLSLHLAAACWSMLTIIITILVHFSPPPPQQPPPPLPPPSLQRPQLLGCLRFSDRKYKCPPTYLLIGFPKAGTDQWLKELERICSMFGTRPPPHAQLPARSPLVKALLHSQGPP